MIPQYPVELFSPQSNRVFPDCRSQLTECQLIGPLTDICRQLILLQLNTLLPR